MEGNMKSYAPINRYGIVTIPTPILKNITQLKDKRLSYFASGPIIIIYDAEINLEDLKTAVPEFINKELDFLAEQKLILSEQKLAIEKLKAKYNKNQSSS